MHVLKKTKTLLHWSDSNIAERVFLCPLYPNNHTLPLSLCQNSEINIGTILLTKPQNYSDYFTWVLFLVLGAWGVVCVLFVGFFLCFFQSPFSVVRSHPGATLTWTVFLVPFSWWQFHNPSYAPWHWQFWIILVRCLYNVCVYVLELF